MFEVIKKDETTASNRRVYFSLVDSTDGITPKDIVVTGVKARFSKNGAALAATTNDITKITDSNNKPEYYIEFTAGEVDTLGQIRGYIDATGCAKAPIQATIVNYDPYAAGPTVQNIVDGVLNEATAGHVTAGTVGKAIVDILDDTGTSGVAIANGAITNGKFAANALDTSQFTAALLNAITDNLLKRDMSVVTGEAARSPLNALRAVRNKVSIAAGTLTVTKEDDITAAWTAAVTGSPAVTNVDPV